MTDWTIRLNDTIIRTFSIHEGQTITIGRGEECDVTIDNIAISRKHISLRLKNDIYFLSDLGSINSSFVNDKKIENDEPVSESDTITFSKFTLSPIKKGESIDKINASIARDMMERDAETMCVPGKKEPTATGQRLAPKGDGHRITLLHGNAFPRELSLAGNIGLKIGRNPSCDLVVSGWMVAPAQAYIIKRESGYILIPMKSWASTYINDTKINSEHPLRPGDIITIRGTALRFD